MSTGSKSHLFGPGNTAGRKFQPGNKFGAGIGPTRRRIREIRKLAQDQCEASFRVLFKIRDDKNEEASARIAACKEIIRYGIGEPPKVVDEGDDSPADTLDALTLDELRSLARQSLVEEVDADEDADDESGEPN